MWNSGAASIVLDDNGAGWPQLVTFLVVVTNTNIAIMTANL